MAYDEELTVRFRKALGKRQGITAKRMMGGICFMNNGNMIGGADRNKSGVGRFMFRVGKDLEAQALSRKGAIIMEQGGRRMSGMLLVDSTDCSDAELAEWVGIALGFVETLPPK